MNEYKNKHAKKVEEIQMMLRYGNLHGLMSAHCSKIYWDFALDHLIKTNDTNGFCVLLQGA